MTYNVFGGTLNLAQSINQCGVLDNLVGFGGGGPRVAYLGGGPRVADLVGGPRGGA